MFSLIAFILKLLFGAILGGALAYDPVKIQDESKILYSALISLAAVSIVSISGLSPLDTTGFVLGSTIFTVIIAVILLTKDLDFGSRILFMFAAIIGIVCGTGHIFYGVSFTVIVYFILTWGHRLFEKSEIDPLSEDMDTIEKI